MIDIIVSLDGKPSCGVERLEDGSVVPAASPEEMHCHHQDTIEEQVTLGKVAERLGYDYVTHPEIHFPLVATLSPNPVLTQMAIAEATTDIGLLPTTVPEWHDPIRLAERLGMLDVVSDGRLEVMLAKGVDTRGGKVIGDYFGQFWGGTSLNERRQNHLFEEKFEILLQAWTETLFTYDGEFHEIPTKTVERSPSDMYMDRRYLESDISDHAVKEHFTSGAGPASRRSLMVAPQPKQDPHPPLWLSISSPKDARWAARRGLNGIGVSRSFRRVEQLVSAYHETARQVNWPDRTDSGTSFARGWDSNRRRGVGASVAIFNTEVANKDTIKRWKRGKEFVVKYTALSGSTDSGRIDTVGVERAIKDWDSPIVGSTEEIISELRRLKEICGYKDLLLAVSFDAHGLTANEKHTQMKSLVDDVLPRVE